MIKNHYSIIPKKCPHRYFADFQNPWTIFWVHFDGTNAKHFIAGQEYPRAILESPQARLEDRSQLHEEMLLILEEGFSIHNLEYSSVLLTQYLGSLKYLSQFQKFKETQQSDEVSKAIAFMKSHIKMKISLEDIAEHCGLSLSHFCLVFKRKTSHSPIEYFTILRLQKACNMLCFSDQKINKIAQAVGYDDPYYFTRVFTKTMGLSPRDYRKEHGE